MKRHDTNSLRNNNIAARKRLTAAQILAASEAVAARVWQIGPLHRSRKIGMYFAVNGEIDCEFIAAEAWKRGRNVYLPVVFGRELQFAPYRRGTQFSRNRYGIPEPEHKKCELLQARDLDAVMAPLVAFDSLGNRVGMGAGYYDRSLRILKTRRQWRRPCFIGVAHDFQKTAQIKASSWDVPLHYAVTESNTYRFQGAPAGN
jgi:5-formyltetrahydrofolate cyclo-ligase